jgi:hypothetical protein
VIVDEIRAEHVQAARYAAAQRKARWLWPGPVGEAVATQLAGGLIVWAVLGPGSLTARLLVEVEGLPEPAQRP